MKILAFESSAKAASVAYAEAGALVAQYFQNSGLTHSVTLLKMAEDMLHNLGLSMDAPDAIAVAAGPGSFTGVRIGVSAAKGLAFGAEKPVIGVSTLLAMAHQGFDDGELICAVMDARRNETYNALFLKENGQITRLCDDRAIAISELIQDLKTYDRAPRLVGDGTALCAAAFTDAGLPCSLAPMPMLHQTAWGVAAAAQFGTPVSASALEPSYLRLSQAERERLQRESQG